MANPGGIPGADFFDSAPDFADWATNPTILLIIAAVAAFLGQDCVDAAIPEPYVPSDEDTPIVPCPEETAEGLLASQFFAIDARTLELTDVQLREINADGLPDVDFGFELTPVKSDAPPGLSAWMDDFQKHLEGLTDEHRIKTGIVRTERFRQERRAGSFDASPASIPRTSSADSIADIARL